MQDDTNKKQRLVSIIIALILYLIMFGIGYINTKDDGEKWWIVAFAVIACHIYLSIVVINERQLGAMFILGRAICDLKSGPHFAFWPLCYVRRETKNIVQLEIGILTDKEREKAISLESSMSVYVLEDPFYLNWGHLDAASYEMYPENERDARKKSDLARFRNDPLAKPAITATHLTVRFEIWSLTCLIGKAGSLQEAIELIQKAATAALISYAGKSFVAKAIANMEEVDEWLKTTVEEFVSDPDSKRFKKDPSRSWGINIRKTQITRV